MYDINYIRLILWHIPELIGLPKMMSLVDCMITPVKMIYADFKMRRELDIYKLNHNGQVCYLEAALNDSFDDDQRRIYITDGNRYDRIYIYTTAEQRPRYIRTTAENDPVYIYPRSDYTDTGVDFIVNVPAVRQLSINPYEISALVDFYKLDPKRYKIVYV